MTLGRIQPPRESGLTINVRRHILVVPPAYLGDRDNDTAGLVELWANGRNYQQSCINRPKHLAMSHFAGLFSPFARGVDLRHDLSRIQHTP